MSQHTPRASRIRGASTARAALVATLLAGLGIDARPVGAQEIPASLIGGFELRPFAGAYIPTGEQRDFLRDALFVGAQASYRVVQQLAVTGTIGWSPTKDRITRGDQSLDVFHYDVGLEGRAVSLLAGNAWDFSPFIGAGVGGRTYNYRDLDVDAESRFVGYGALGGELGFGRVGVRVEGRDYLSRFKPLIGGGESDTRNDVTVSAGLTIRF